MMEPDNYHRRRRIVPEPDRTNLTVTDEELNAWKKQLADEAMRVETKRIYKRPAEFEDLGRTAILAGEEASSQPLEQKS